MAKTINNLLNDIKSEFGNEQELLVIEKQKNNEMGKESLKLQQLIERQAIYVKRWITIKIALDPEWAKEIIRIKEQFGYKDKTIDNFINQYLFNMENPCSKETFNLTYQSFINKIDQELFDLMKEQVKEFEHKFPEKYHQQNTLDRTTRSNINALTYCGEDGYNNPIWTKFGERVKGIDNNEEDWKVMDKTVREQMNKHFKWFGQYEWIKEDKIGE